MCYSENNPNIVPIDVKVMDELLAGASIVATVVCYLISLWSGMSIMLVFVYFLNKCCHLHTGSETLFCLQVIFMMKRKLCDLVFVHRGQTWPDGATAYNRNQELLVYMPKKSDWRCEVGKRPYPLHCNWPVNCKSVALGSEIIEVIMTYY